MRTGAPPRTQQITSIVMMVALLVMIVVMRKQCAQGTANLFNVVATVPDGGVPSARPLPHAVTPDRDAGRAVDTP